MQNDILFFETNQDCNDRYLSQRVDKYTASESSWKIKTDMNKFNESIMKNMFKYMVKNQMSAEIKIGIEETLKLMKSVSRIPPTGKTMEFEERINLYTSASLNPPRIQSSHNGHLGKH